MFQLLLTHLHCIHVPYAPRLPAFFPEAPGVDLAAPEAPRVKIFAPQAPGLDLSWIVAPKFELPRIDAPSPPCITSP